MRASSVAIACGNARDPVRITRDDDDRAIQRIAVSRFEQQRHDVYQELVRPRTFLALGSQRANARVHDRVEQLARRIV